MTPKTRAALQERIVASIQRAHPGTPKTAIAAAAGVGKAAVSHWEDDGPNGERITIDALVAMVDEYGAPAVLGPIAERAGARVAVATVEAAPDALESAARIDELGGTYFRTKIRALRDGKLDGAEKAELRGILRELLSEVEASDAGLREVGRPA